MKLTFAIGAVATALVVMPTTASAAPAWCKGGDATEKPSYDLKTMFTETDVNRSLLNLVAATCYPENDLKPYAKQVEATRAAWSKKLQLTDADWGMVNEWAHLSQAERGQNTFFATDRKAAWSSYGPLDQFAELSSANSGDVDGGYVADAIGDKLTQLGRLGYVRFCMERAKQDDGPVALAMCATDIAALDMAKLVAEINRDKSHGTADRMTARIVAYETLAERPQLQAQIAALQKKDDAYAKMFALGEAAHKQWGSVDPKLVQLVSDLDDAHVTGSRKASKDCMPRALEAWTGAVQALGAKPYEGIRSEPGNEFMPQMIAIVVKQPNGYLAALALNVCANLEKKDDALTRLIGAALVRWPGFRGPRTGTQTAIYTAGLELDQRDQTIEYPEIKREFITGDPNTGTFGFGTVLSVKAAGDKSTITFKKEKVKQTRCVKGHRTNQISQILDGTVHYYYVCDKEVNEVVEVPPSPPVKVIARYATDLKPGMVIRVSDDVVPVAYPNKNSTTPVLVAGVKVK